MKSRSGAASLGLIGTLALQALMIRKVALDELHAVRQQERDPANRVTAKMNQCVCQAVGTNVNLAECTCARPVLHSYRVAMPLRSTGDKT